MERRAFRAMGTDVELLLDVPSSVESFLVLASAERELERLEALLSRFREDSELSTLNRDGRVLAGPELLEVTQLALEARARTVGRFDPTVHDALVAAGYDRSFEHVEGPVAVVDPPTRCGGRISIDTEARIIELEIGTHLDLGGIAKGWAVDRLCTLLGGSGPCLVDAGGDIAVRGAGWPVGVETTDGMLTLELSDSALATTGVDRRRWSTTHGEAHHVIDPETGRPAEGDLWRVTVVAPSAADAEVLAKSLFLAGARRAEREANEGRTPAVLVTRAGKTIVAGGLA
jgi:thiamine biosynthesis lipoprotein